ncbi:flagellar filament capping protein FliD [Hydrogenimonas urashimensis]|uniref:flagellar filament capping protein FliD n=1 Tax=Hydrogenimonas urashimensis TaxID=2740515 RepID=UPI00191660C1|nr:flagellar filament capping protein FliD [Hydrogenimonas urashimensis]
MALGTTSFIGLGSGGALSYDIIDKLREVDEKAIIEPLDKKIESGQNKEQVFQDILSKLHDLQNTLFDIAGPTLYGSRKIDITGSDIEATVTDGAPVQDVNIMVKQLATADIKQTKGFASEDSVVTDTDTDMTISIDGEDTTFTVSAGTTLKELKAQIAGEMDGKLTVTLLNTGAGDTPYELILKTRETGSANAMAFSFGGGNDFLDLTSSNASLQDAQDAIVNIDGVDVTRSGNSITDAISGVTFTLNQVSTATNRISVTQDNDAVADKVQDFVDKYNEIMTNLKNVTKYDADSEEAGVFQGDSTVGALKRQISTIVMEIAPNGKALNEFGIDVDRYGKMSFDRSTFIDALQKDPDTIQETFAGTTDDAGVMAHLKNYLDDVTKYGGLLSKYDEFLKNGISELEERKEKAIERLDNKYEIMAKQFMAYDAMIAKMNASFNNLATMIEAQAAAAKK